MTVEKFLSQVTGHFIERELPFKVEDVSEFNIITGMITLSNDEHPYIIRIEKLPIESDYDDEQKVNILSGTKNNQS